MDETSSTEKFMCSYGVNDRYRDRLFSEGLVVTGTDHEDNVRIVERPGQPFWMATLFVPQLSSQPEAPHPLLSSFVKRCRSHSGNPDEPPGRRTPGTAGRPDSAPSDSTIPCG